MVQRPLHDRPRPEPAFSLTYPRLTLVVFLALVVWAGLRLAGGGLSPLHDPEAEPRPVVARGSLAEDERSTIALFEAASPSVVNIATQRAIRRGRGFSARTTLVPEGTGTGFVWDEDGHIVTNYHVLLGADAATITFGSGESFPARLVKGAPERDLAVLKVEARPSLLRPIAIGSSENLRVGQKAFAIGYPFGLDQTLTVGVLSGLNRTIDSVTESPLAGVIQTDAAINPGNSGGPLLDSAGRLIGVNTAIASRTGSSSGVGFALPVDMVNATVAALIRDEEVLVQRGGQPPRLGIFPSESQAVSFGVEGVVVGEVLAGSGAAAAGLRGLEMDEGGRTLLGDVIVGVDTRKVRDLEDLRAFLADYQPGERVDVTVDRAGRGGRFREVVDVELMR